MGVQRVPGANAQAAANRFRKNDLTSGRNFRQHRLEHFTRCHASAAPHQFFMSSQAGFSLVISQTARTGNRRTGSIIGQGVGSCDHASQGEGANHRVWRRDTFRDHSENFNIHSSQNDWTDCLLTLIETSSDEVIRRFNGAKVTQRGASCCLTSLSVSHATPMMPSDMSRETHPKTTGETRIMSWSSPR